MTDTPIGTTFELPLPESLGISEQGLTAECTRCCEIAWVRPAAVEHECPECGLRMRIPRDA